jgi:hypothetical protein
VICSCLCPSPSLHSECLLPFTVSWQGRTHACCGLGSCWMLGTVVRTLKGAAAQSGEAPQISKAPVVKAGSPRARSHDQDWGVRGRSSLLTPANTWRQSKCKGLELREALATHGRVENGRQAGTGSCRALQLGTLATLPQALESCGRVLSRAMARSVTVPLTRLPRLLQQMCCAQPAGWESEIACTCSALGEVLPLLSASHLRLPESRTAQCL